MDRKLEPELMEDWKQVKAYAEADFSEPHHNFVTRICEHIGFDFSGKALDLGCGPGDISFQFAKTFPRCQIDALDGSKPMLDYGKNTCPNALIKQINFIHAKLPLSKPPAIYDLIFSNSLLHHLPDPQVLWQTIKQCAGKDGSVIVMDLLRPMDEKIALQLVEQYANKEPDILKHDFYHSLLAAFTLDEINLQLAEAELTLNIQQVSDRHVLIKGRVT